MISEIKIPSVNTPKLLQVTTKKEADQMKLAGLPYIWSKLDAKILYAIIFRKWFEKHFPYMNFWKALGINKVPKKLYVNIPYDEGQVNTYTDGFDECEQILIEDYINIQNVEISIDKLKSIGLIPMFLSDIETAIKSNLTGFNFQDGYNKKSGLLTGSFTAGTEKPNLLILDISGSMNAVSSTILALAHTMMNSLNADVIVTGGSSRYWANGYLPAVEYIRNNIGFGNESVMFTNIMMNLNEKEYGNVVVFGDGDSQSKKTWDNIIPENWHVGVDKLYSYHTSYKYTPGYALWIKWQDDLLGKETPEEINCDWVKWL